MSKVKEMLQDQLLDESTAPIQCTLCHRSIPAKVAALETKATSTCSACRTGKTIRHTEFGTHSEAYGRQSVYNPTGIIRRFRKDYD